MPNQAKAPYLGFTAALMALIPLAPASAREISPAPSRSSSAYDQRSGADLTPSGKEDPRTIKRTARALYAVCSAAPSGPTNWCAAYLMGVADTLTAFGAGGHKGGICGADYVIDELPGIFVAWARDNDTFLDFDMLAGVSLAFRQQWPCR